MDVVVGLDVHLKKTHGTIMLANGKVVKQARFETKKEELRAFLKDVPTDSMVALESLGFCWPWVDFLEGLGYKVLLANPLKVKQRAEDIKTDKLDSELLAQLLRVGWLPTSYLPTKELRLLRSKLRHRFFRVKLITALKNRTWSEFRKLGIDPELSLSTNCGRELASSFEIPEVNDNLKAIELLDYQSKKIEAKLKAKYSKLKPVMLLQSIPGIGFITALTLYAEICDIKRFKDPEKLSHYAGLVPRAINSGEHVRAGRETKGNKWLKWLLIEASWSHLRFCPQGRLAEIFHQAYRRKRSKRKAIKIVARKLVNIIWAVWWYERKFDAYE